MHGLPAWPENGLTPKPVQAKLTAGYQSGFPTTIDSLVFKLRGLEALCHAPAFEWRIADC